MFCLSKSKSKEKFEPRSDNNTFAKVSYKVEDRLLLPFSKEKARRLFKTLLNRDYNLQADKKEKHN
jgi:hypothetical protein